jgi:protein-tyrosine-phosphatase
MTFPNSDLLRISTICRANEVRSKIIEGYLRKLYPNFEIRSFGTEVVEGNRISSSLTRLMNGWGIQINQAPANSIFSQIEFINTSNLVISADGEVSDKLDLIGISSINVCDYAIDHFHTPFDPINFRGDEFIANAAKVIHCTARMISQVIKHQENNGSIWVYTTSDNAIQDYLRKDAIVIDVRLRHRPKPLGFRDETTFFEEQELLDGSLFSKLHSGIKTYLPKYEFRNPEEVLLSDKFSEFVSKVSSLGEVELITSSLTEHDIFQSEPYLASILAERVIYL